MTRETLELFKRSLFFERASNATAEDSVFSFERDPTYVHYILKYMRESPDSRKTHAWLRDLSVGVLKSLCKECEFYRLHELLALVKTVLSERETARKWTLFGTGMMVVVTTASFLLFRSMHGVEEPSNRR